MVVFFVEFEAIDKEARRRAKLIEIKTPAVAEDVAGFIGTSQAMLWRELVIEDIEDGSKVRARRFEVLRRLHSTRVRLTDEGGFFFEFEPSRGVPRSRGSRETRTLADGRGMPRDDVEARLDGGRHAMRHVAARIGPRRRMRSRRPSSRSSRASRRPWKKTGLYIDVSKNIKNFINTIPLIAALQSPSMRPRHWELLRKATKEFVPPHEDEDLQLGGLLSLNLHEFNTDVEEILHDQATKEEKIEVRAPRPVTPSTRVVSGERTGVRFGRTPASGRDRRGRGDGVGATSSPRRRLHDHTRVVSRRAGQPGRAQRTLGQDRVFVRLLQGHRRAPSSSSAKEDYEALENDQLTVQGMMASRYVAQFERGLYVVREPPERRGRLHVRSRRPVGGGLHAIDATRGHRTTTWE